MKKRKPLWARLLIGLFSTVLSIVVLAGCFCGFLYFKYQINVFNVIGQIKTINQAVDLENLTPNAYAISDLQSAKAVTDLVFLDFIEYDSVNDKYIIPGNVQTSLSGDIKLTDKQIGAVIGNIVDSQESIDVQLGGNVNLKDYGFKVVQIEFSEITELTADFNVVIKIEMQKVKEKMTSFPLNWLVKVVPEELYISSTITITHGTDAFAYTTDGKCMRINNLTENDTAEIMKIANTFLKTGTEKDFAKIIGDTFANILIGNATTPGLAYSLKEAGGTPMASDYTFEADATNNYFVIKKA